MLIALLSCDLSSTHMSFAGQHLLHLSALQEVLVDLLLVVSQLTEQYLSQRKGQRSATPTINTVDPYMYMYLFILVRQLNLDISLESPQQVGIDGVPQDTGTPVEHTHMVYHKVGKPCK